MIRQISYHRNFLLHLRERAGYDQLVLIKEPANDPPSNLQIKQLHGENNITQQLSDVVRTQLVAAKLRRQQEGRLAALIA